MTITTPLTQSTPDQAAGHVLILDHHKYWRELAKHALESSGFRVSAQANYNYPTTLDDPFNKPTVVILSCACIGPDEFDAIERLLAHGHCLVVLSAVTISMDMMRLLFLRGAKEVTQKTYRPAQILKIVRDTLERSKPRDGYELVARGILT